MEQRGMAWSDEVRCGVAGMFESSESEPIPTLGKSRKIAGTKKGGLKWWARLLRPLLVYEHAFRIWHDEGDTGWKEAVAVSKHFYYDVIASLHAAEDSGIDLCVWNGRECDGTVRRFILPKKSDEGWNLMMPACEAHDPRVILADSEVPGAHDWEIADDNEPL